MSPNEQITPLVLTPNEEAVHADQRANFLRAVTPLVLTFNEEENLARTLSQLEWARDVVVLDSYSTDTTREIAQRFANVRFIQRRFDDHTAQWNFGLAQVRSDWVLSLDADYLLSAELVKELKNLCASDVVAWVARFQYYIHGRPLRASLYPPRVVLFRKDRCSYVPDGHTQLLKVNGRAAFLNGVIFHDDRKPLSRWLAAQDKYAQLEAAHLCESATRRTLPDRVRRTIILGPFAVFFYTLLVKRLILDGWPGWYYVFQRTIAEMILSLHLIDAKLIRHPPALSASTGERDQR